jgi:hypothetical protein
VLQLHLCKSKSHSACRNLTLRKEIALCVDKSHRAGYHHNMHVNIALWKLDSAWKSHFARKNHNRECRNHISACQNLTLRAKIALCVHISHSACGN